MDSRRTSIAAMYIVLSSLVTTSAWADAPLALPAVGIHDDLIDTLQRPLQDDLWQCASTTDKACPCVELQVHRGRAVLFDVIRNHGVLSADRVVFFSEAGHLDAQSLRLVEDEQGFSLSSETIHWFHAESSELLLKGRSLSATRKSSRSTAEVQNPTWYDGQRTLPPVSCSDGRHQADSAIEPLELAPRARAHRALFEEEWQVEGLRITGFAGPVGTTPLAPGEAASGVLPPSLTWAGDELLLTGSYRPTTAPLLLRGHASSVGAAGLGAAALTQTPFCAEPPCDRQEFAVDFFMQRDSPAAVAHGRATVGSARRHFSAEIDGLAWSDLDPSIGEGLRWQSDSTFRRSTLQRVGIALGGAEHHFSVHAASATLTHPVASSQGTVGAGALGVQYGTSLDLGRGVQAELRAIHEEFGGPLQSSGRLSQIRLGVDRIIGEPSRAFLRPGLRGDLAVGIAEGENGEQPTTAGSQATLDTFVEGRLRFRGHLAGLPHYISPGLVVGQRVRRDDGFPSLVQQPTPTAATAGFERRATFAHLRLDQTVRLPGSLRIRFPLGATWVIDPRSQVWLLSPETSVIISSVSDERTHLVALDARCSHACRDLGLSTRLQIQWSQPLSSHHIVGIGTPLGAGLMNPGQRVRIGDPTASLAAYPMARGPHQAHFLRGYWQRWHAGLEGFGPINNPSGSGAAMQARYYWPALGLGVGARIAAIPADRRWQAMVGLSTSPAF